MDMFMVGRAPQLQPPNGVILIDISDVRTPCGGCARLVPRGGGGGGGGGHGELHLLPNKQPHGIGAINWALVMVHKV